jgi:hypothetical protein
MDDGEEHSQDWKADTPENRREGQTLPLRQVPEAKPEAGQDAGPLVLPQLRQSRCGLGTGHRAVPYHHSSQ